MVWMISIHSLVKRETRNQTVRRRLAAISIHSLVKRETGHDYARRRAAGDFNPLPRKEGDVVWMGAVTMGKISIHSLVKRETEMSAIANLCML